MSNLVEIAVFPSRLEAETVGHALDQHGIPFLVQSHDVGMFGPGMVGFTPGGASLQVPEEHLEEVRRLLDCVVKPIPEGELPAELSEPSSEPEPPS
ncbi:MAG: DUF2007 domain-containing protein [Holophagales bacterium]|nr:DUF2007 domain-containing protein [Holophagales bacterium]